MSTCPKCRRKQYFTCGRKDCTCYTGLPKGKKHQIYLGNDALACPYCGFGAHINFWEERDMRDV